MSFTKREFKVQSSDKIHTLSGVIYVPDCEIKGFFHIVHGMTEYIGRYDRFMRDMCESGYITFGYDNLGHGNTAKDKTELGYIAKKNGWDLLARDVRIFSDAVRHEYSALGDIPYYLMGHSMGSFIVRVATEKYVSPDKLVVMGTGGPNPAAGAGLAVVGTVKLFKGDRYISRLIDKLAFGSYNKKFASEEGADGGSWLTCDKSVRRKFHEDDFCNFKFTVSAMGDLIRIMKYANRGAWFKNMPNIPILLISGEDDPVGNYGKGVKTVHKKLSAKGKNSKLVLYKGARHEILNDFTYEETKREISEFLSGN